MMKPVDSPPPGLVPAERCLATRNVAFVTTLATGGFTPPERCLKRDSEKHGSGGTSPPVAM